MFEDYVNFNEREANKMYFWTRPTIEWKLECEYEGNSRQIILDAAEKFNSIPKTNVLRSFNLSIILVASAFIVGIWVFVLFLFGCL